MKKEFRDDIHKIVKEKFGTNQLSDEKFSKQKYWDTAISKDEEHSESARANPDILSEESNIWPEVYSDEKAIRLEALKEVGELLKGREREVYLLLLKYPYTEGELAKRLQVSQQRISVILQRISRKVYKKYGSKKADYRY